MIDLVSGNQLYGNVRRGPNFAADGVQELYVTYPRWRTDTGWTEADEEAVIVRLAEVSTISLSRDPCVDGRLRNEETLPDVAIDQVSATS